MTDDDEERRAIVLPEDFARAYGGEHEMTIRRSSWRVKCGDCGAPCYLASGTPKIAPDHEPMCVPCFERRIGHDRARFHMGRAFAAYSAAHALGRCVPGYCPVLGCPHGPATVN